MATENQGVDLRDPGKPRTAKRGAPDAHSEIYVDHLIQKLRFDGDEIVRSNAAGALGHTKSKKAIDPLIYALRDRHVYVRNVAAWALGEIGSKRAIDALKLAALSDDDELTRGKATEALWKIQRDSEVNLIEFR